MEKTAALVSPLRFRIISGCTIFFDSTSGPGLAWPGLAFAIAAGGGARRFRQFSWFDMGYLDNRYSTRYRLLRAGYYLTSGCFVPRPVWLSARLSADLAGLGSLFFPIALLVTMRQNVACGCAKKASLWGENIQL